LGVGLGCNGIIHILIEPIAVENPDNPIQKLKDFLSKRQEAVLVTLFCLADRHASQPGTCLMITDAGQVTGTLPATLTDTAIFNEAKTVLQNKSSRVKNYVTGEQKLTAFIEFLQPAVSLIIIGAGNDVLPLVQMAGILGWETTVVDGRPNLATVERFPAATKVLVAKASQVVHLISIDAQTAFVLMTHNYNYDWAVLKALMLKEVSYIGVLGPKKKMDRMLLDLAEDGLIPTEAQRDSLFGPLGLDIGAETSEEIALSVLSEIKAVLSKRAGKFLREKQETIHPRHPLSCVPHPTYTGEPKSSCALSQPIQ
jgi:xanthine dehydrogenase accessory factor